MTDCTYNIKDISVFIGMPTHTGALHVDTVSSLMRTSGALAQLGVHHEVQLVAGSSIVEAARSKVAHLFLASDKNRLFMIDSDMAWEPDDLISLLALSTEVECVGVPYPSKQENSKFFINLDKSKAGQDGALSLTADKRGCLHVNGMGLGFVCVQRKVIEQLAERSPKLIFPDTEGSVAHIFRCDADGEYFRGEDMAFFADVRALGYDVNLYPNINLSHIGIKAYKASFADSLRKEDESIRKNRQVSCAA